MAEYSFASRRLESESLPSAYPNRCVDARTSDLRRTAQQHLNEIARQEERDNQLYAIKTQQLETFAKAPRQARRKLVTRNSVGKTIGAHESHSPSISDVDTTPADERGPKMRTAEDILKRLAWDSNLNIKLYKIGYLERFKGLVEIDAARWVEITEREDSTGDDWIPLHRIKYFKCIDPETGIEEVVWDRGTKTDVIFSHVN